MFTKLSGSIKHAPRTAFQHLPVSFHHLSSRVLPHRVTPSTRAFSVHSTAFVHPTARLSATTHIGPFAYVGPGVTIGKETSVGAHCTVLNCKVGDRVLLHSGVRIGQDGFGFFPTPSTPSTPSEATTETTTETTATANATTDAAPPPIKKPQELQVILHDDVEIGANSTIDRGSWRDTVIHAGTKIDNLVHIAHNVVVGESCLIAAQTGIAGSTTVQERVLIGGQVGIAQHLTIGVESRIAAKSGVVENVLDYHTVAGYPAVDIRTFRRNVGRARRETKKKKKKETGDGIGNEEYVDKD